MVYQKIKILKSSVLKRRRELRKMAGCLLITAIDQDFHLNPSTRQMFSPGRTKTLTIRYNKRGAVAYMPYPRRVAVAAEFERCACSRLTFEDFKDRGYFHGEDPGQNKPSAELHYVNCPGIELWPFQDNHWTSVQIRGHQAQPVALWNVCLLISTCFVPRLVIGPNVEGYQFNESSYGGSGPLDLCLDEAGSDFDFTNATLSLIRSRSITVLNSAFLGKTMDNLAMLIDGSTWDSLRQIYIEASSPSVLGCLIPLLTYSTLRSISSSTDGLVLQIRLRTTDTVALDTIDFTSLQKALSDFNSTSWFKIQHAIGVWQVTEHSSGPVPAETTPALAPQ
jgi:hypothetical protein